MSFNPSTHSQDTTTVTFSGKSAPKSRDTAGSELRVTSTTKKDSSSSATRRHLDSNDLEEVVGAIKKPSQSTKDAFMQLRTELGVDGKILTQKELAVKLNLKVVDVADFEAGRRDPPGHVKTAVHQKLALIQRKKEKTSSTKN